MACYIITKCRAQELKSAQNYPATVDTGILTVEI